MAWQNAFNHLLFSICAILLWEILIIIVIGLLYGSLWILERLTRLEEKTIDKEKLAVKCGLIKTAYDQMTIHLENKDFENLDILFKSLGQVLIS